MLSPDAALSAMSAALEPLDARVLSVAEAHRHVLTEDVRAATALPPFTQSAVDGYALRASDLRAADPHRSAPDGPWTLPVRGESAAAPVATWPTLASGTVMRVFTGGPVPSGADTVVMQEQVTRDGEHATFLEVPEVGANTRVQGEEVAHGDVLLRAGTALGAAQVAAIAMAGVASVSVRRRPIVHVWVGGDEIVDAGPALKPGQVYDANGPLMEAWFRERGLAVQVRRLPDDRAAVAAALDASLTGADLVVTTGGVSVGDHDHVVPAAESVGVSRVFWRVAQKPGKPLYVGTRGRAAVIGLPGNPGAVFVGLTVFVDAALRVLEQAAPPRWSMAALAAPYPATRGRAHFVRVRTAVDAQGSITVEPLPKQASHMVSNLAECDALAWLPASDTAFAAGTCVRWRHA
jgi:molybdopterin molybdotransferase